ncbi:MAG: hypothetical protein G01um10142_295 [Parcubacteria group bacterium Gr01-1014_2]|nr:MAG: hypothetical protein G01um10142_295 [Parcubacteria group bacterium Gr01-1014_2]
MAKYNDITAGQTEACINRIGGLDNFLRFIGGQGRIVFETILTFLRAVRMPAQPAVTTSEEYFNEAGVVWMGGNFNAQLLGLEVVATEDAELAIRKLEEASLDAPILAELGDKAEISVSQFRAFLAENRESREWFIFYLKGKDGNLWAVRASWLDDGWYVHANSVEHPYEWDRGHRVLSR